MRQRLEEYSFHFKKQNHFYTRVSSFWLVFRATDSPQSETAAFVFSTVGFLFNLVPACFHFCPSPASLFLLFQLHFVYSLSCCPSLKCQFIGKKKSINLQFLHIAFLLNSDFDFLLSLFYIKVSLLLLNRISNCYFIKAITFLLFSTVRFRYFLFKFECFDYCISVFCSPVEPFLPFRG